jgi:spectinomycin phosphotransferase
MTWIFAPKNAIMFIGTPRGLWVTPQQEEALFYAGYGALPVDPVGLAYYRCERPLVDIALYCQDIFLTTEGGADREQALQNVMSNFQPQGTIDMAYRADRLLRES